VAHARAAYPPGRHIAGPGEHKQTAIPQMPRHTEAAAREGNVWPRTGVADTTSYAADL
jgi:hypothetical protein